MPRGGFYLPVQLLGRTENREHETSGELVGSVECVYVRSRSEHAGSAQYISPIYSDRTAFERAEGV
jgi:hypothetical protein